jgi:Flp pilus assembly protein TadD
MKYYFTICAVLSAACTGCASFPGMFPLSKPKESEQTYAERKQHAVTAFEKQRDKAQVQAAVSCWERGEVPKSLAMLEAIVQRNPADVTARLRLAEIHASQTNFAAATELLAECLRLAPDHAEAHHNLGLILSETPGQEEQARVHLRRACELEPENELYLAAAHEAGDATAAR